MEGKRIELREMQHPLVNLITRHLRFRGFEVQTDIEGITSLEDERFHNTYKGHTLLGFW